MFRFYKNNKVTPAINNDIRHQTNRFARISWNITIRPIVDWVKASRTSKGFFAWMYWFELPLADFLPLYRRR